MGNGPGVKYEGSVFEFDTVMLTETMINNAALKAAANFGAPNRIFMPIHVLSHMGWEPNPQYSGTEWAKCNRMSKREHAFAKLQVFLIKFGLQKHLEDADARRADCEVVSKRLRRAKWARYQQRKSR